MDIGIDEKCPDCNILDKCGFCGRDYHTHRREIEKKKPSWLNILEPASNSQIRPTSINLSWMANRKRVAAVSYGASVIAPKKENGDPLIAIRKDYDLNIFPRDPNGVIMQKIEGWDYGNCAETNPWIYLTKLKPNIPIKTRTILRCANEKKEATLSKLRELPDYLREQLNKNNHWEFHQITEKYSLDFVDSEYFSYLNEKFGIRGAQPIFIDHSEYVIWILDEDDNMYEWNEMERGLKYLGKDLIEGLTNFFIYPDDICEVMEDTGERIPVKEFKLKMKEKAKEIWDDRIILNIN